MDATGVALCNDLKQNINKNRCDLTISSHEKINDFLANLGFGPSLVLQERADDSILCRKTGGMSDYHIIM